MCPHVFSVHSRTFWSSVFSHFLVVCFFLIISIYRVPSASTFWSSVRHLCCFFPPPPLQTTNCVPHCCSINTFFHSTTLLLNPMLSNPLLPNPCCVPYTLPLGSTPVTHPPCHTPNPLPPLLPLLSTIIHALIWCRGRSLSIGPRAADVFAERDAYGSLFGVCDDAVWAILNTPAGQQLRAHPDFPIPADL